MVEGMISRPMKGAAVDELSDIRLPVLASPKIDGFRCVLDRHPLTSRLSPFPNKYFHDEMTHRIEVGVQLDGEVVVGKRRGKDVLQRTSSGLTKMTGEPDFTMWVFDVPGPAEFQVRLKQAKRMVHDLNDARIRFLRHEMIRGYQELQEYLDLCLAEGFEGIITRDPKGMYKEGKSTLKQQWMLKVKPFEDAEGVVKDWFEEMENTNEPTRDAIGKQKRSSAKSGKVAKGRLGGFILSDLLTGVEVRVGGGFSADQRRAYWTYRHDLVGKLVRYKKQKVGEKDRPRHPNFVEFVDFRPEWDMSD